MYQVGSMTTWCKSAEMRNTFNAGDFIVNMVSSLTNPNEGSLGILIQHDWNHQLRRLTSFEYCSLDLVGGFSPLEKY